MKTVEDKTKIPEGYSGEEEDPGIIVSILLHLSTYLFPFIFIYNIALSISTVGETSYLLLIPSAILSILFADFASGLVHWLCDTYGDFNTPIFGQAFIRVFRLHHKYPKDICKSKFEFTIGYVSFLANATLPFFTLLLIYNPNSLILGLTSFTYSLVTLITVFTNQFHKWAHTDQEKLPEFIKKLQRKGIILSPSHHQIHHTYPYRSYYCITNGIMNPFLEKVKFFRTSEKLIGFIFNSKK